MQTRRQAILQTLSVGAFALGALSAKAQTSQNNGRLVLVFLLEWWVRIMVLWLTAIEPKNLVWVE